MQQEPKSYLYYRSVDYNYILYKTYDNRAIDEGRGNIVNSRSIVPCGKRHPYLLLVPALMSRDTKTKKTFGDHPSSASVSLI